MGYNFENQSSECVQIPKNQNSEEPKSRMVKILKKKTKLYGRFNNFLAFWVLVFGVWTHSSKSRIQIQPKFSPNSAPNSAQFWLSNFWPIRYFISSGFCHSGLAFGIWAFGILTFWNLDRGQILLLRDFFKI